MILTVDVGNSRIKWGAFSADGVLQAQGAAEHGNMAGLAAAWRDIGDCRQAVVSNVAGADVAAALRGVFDGLAIPAFWVEASAAACGVVNGYASPGQLGTDRWAAVIAAWHQYGGPCVVATAGTALTVDALSGKGEFLGGLIVPGLRLMREALAVGTAGVAPAEGQWRDFPVSTAEAVYSGALAAMAGAVQRMCLRLGAREQCVPHCLLSGGDADLLAAALDSPAAIEQNLVLQGLFLMGKTF